MGGSACSWLVHHILPFLAILRSISTSQFKPTDYLLRASVSVFFPDYFLFSLRIIGLPDQQILPSIRYCAPFVSFLGITCPLRIEAPYLFETSTRRGGVASGNNYVTMNTSDGAVHPRTVDVRFKCPQVCKTNSAHFESPPLCWRRESYIGLLRFECVTRMCALAHALGYNGFPVIINTRCWLFLVWNE